jgi:ferrochelatase
MIQSSQQAARRAVLLVNLGSPDSPSVRDVRRYLGEFLMDERVIDVPHAARRIIVSGFVLPFRPRRSAAAYRSIWWKEGSPLIVISERMRKALQERVDLPVALAMRYGNPSIESVLRALSANHPRLEEIRVIPLYPHYAMSTVESTVAEVLAAAGRLGLRTRISVVEPFFDNASYINALYARVKPYFEDGFDHVLVSYHGLPERHLRKTDPTGSHCLRSGDCCEAPSVAHRTCYRHQVRVTTRRLMERLGVDPVRYTLSFQSRLGGDSWLKPATAAEVKRLAAAGVKRLLVLSPAFVADCLETLEEIGLGARKRFLAAGGESFTLVPCLNDHPQWIDTLRGFSMAEPEEVRT